MSVIDKAKLGFCVEHGDLIKREYFQNIDKTIELRICKEFRTVALIKNKAGGSWGVIVTFNDVEAKQRYVYVSWKCLQEDPSVASGKLAYFGLEIYGEQRLLVEYLKLQKPKNILCHDLPYLLNEKDEARTEILAQLEGGEKG